MRLMMRTAAVPAGLALLGGARGLGLGAGERGGRGSGKGAVRARPARAGFKGAEPHSCRGTARAGGGLPGRPAALGASLWAWGEPSPPLSLPFWLLEGDPRPNTRTKGKLRPSALEGAGMEKREQSSGMAGWSAQKLLFMLCPRSHSG